MQHFQIGVVMLLRWPAVMLITIAGIGCSQDEPPSVEQTTEQRLQEALRSGDPDVVRATARDVPPDDPQWAASQLILAEAEIRSRNSAGALEYWRNIPRDGSEISIQAAQMGGPVEESLGQLSAAIDSYEYILEHNPEQTALMGRLAELYALTGQRWEADAWLRKLMKTPDLGFKHLVLLTDFERRHGDDFTQLQDLERQSPDDPALQLGLAVEDFNRGNLASARLRLEVVVAKDPELALAQALLGEILLLEASPQHVAAWYRQLPESIQNHPVIWYTRGLWAQQLEEPKVAARLSLGECPAMSHIVPRDTPAGTCVERF